MKRGTKLHRDEGRTGVPSARRRVRGKAVSMSVHSHRCGCVARSRRTASARVRGPVTTTTVISMASGAGLVGEHGAAQLGLVPAVEERHQAVRVNAARRFDDRPRRRLPAPGGRTASPCNEEGRERLGELRHPALAACGCVVARAGLLAASATGSWSSGGQTSVSAMEPGLRIPPRRRGRGTPGLALRALFPPGCERASDNCLRHYIYSPPPTSPAGERPSEGKKKKKRGKGAVARLCAWRT